MKMEVLMERLRKLRSKKDYTQEEVSRLLGINRARYTQYELGSRKPDFETLRKLAELYNTSIDYLLGSTDIEAPCHGNESRDIYMVDDNDLFKAPVVGTIRCGKPILAEENIEGYMFVDSSIIRVNPQEKLFYLRVTGDSMAPKFQPGDLVLVRQQTIVDDGDIAVALVKGEAATLKKVYLSNEYVWLHALNPSFEPMKYPIEEVRIIGKALLRVGKV